jgi:electron transport complex protein RnfG
MRQPSVFTILVGVAMACGLAIALVFQATAGQIESNRAALLEKAVAQVLTGTRTTKGFVIDNGTLAKAATDRADFIASYNESGLLIGVAVSTGIMGYQDRIRMLLGYEPRSETLTGFAVLESRETPGLGSKIGTDPAFLGALAGLDVRLVESALANDITLTTRGDAGAPWQVDGITGATISSNAVIRAINHAAPRLAAIRAGLPEIGNRTETQAPTEESGDA